MDFLKLVHAFDPTAVNVRSSVTGGWRNAVSLPVETQKNEAASIGIEAAGGPSQSCACERHLLDKKLDLTCFSTSLCN